MNPFTNPFIILVFVISGFIALRSLWWLVIEIPRGHAKDEAICEKCWGKTVSDNVTEVLEWCTCTDIASSDEWCDCPQRGTSDKHKENI